MPVVTDLRHHGDAELVPGPGHLRVAVRDPGTSRAFATGLAGILSGEPTAEEIR